MPHHPVEITTSPGNIKLPRKIMPGIFAFAPNRDTLGGTSYLIVNKTGNVLVDCPVWNIVHQEFMESQGGVKTLAITHRGGIGKSVLTMQQALDCAVLVQEQEAYLLPEVEVTSFEEQMSLTPEIEVIWTPGHSPGSSCLYWQQQGGVLFTGRHLLPKSPTEITALRSAKTFHWWRQLNSITRLCERFSAATLQYILPGANTGYLRGKGYIDHDVFEQLKNLDLVALRSQELL